MIFLSHCYVSSINFPTSLSCLFFHLSRKLHQAKEEIQQFKAISFSPTKRCRVFFVILDILFVQHAESTELEYIN